MASVVTRKGKDIWAARQIGATPTQAEPKILSIGVTAPNSFVGTSAATDIGLFDESAESRITGTSSQVTTTTTNDTFQVTGTFTLTGSRAIVEVGLFDSATKPFSTTVAAGASTVIGSSSNTAMNVAASFTPANNTFVQVRSEVMQVTAGTGTTVLTVTRGQNGSSAIATIAAGDIVQVGNLPGTSNQITGGSMAAHFDFSVVNLATNDTFTPTVQIQFT